MSKTSILILVLAILIACNRSSKFNLELLHGKAAWNTFRRDIRKDSLVYVNLIVFYKNRKWSQYMRSSPSSEKIVPAINVDGDKVLSRWSFNENNNIFSRGTGVDYELVSLKKDTIIFHSLNDENIEVIYVRDSTITLPKD